MTISTFELFSVGIGPSSSHTVGPMRAAGLFVDELAARSLLACLDEVGGVAVDLFGSLAATGHGHGTLPAVLLGLEGWRPDAITLAEKDEAVERMSRDGVVLVGGQTAVRLGEADIVLHPREVLERHTNGLRFTARDGGRVVLEREYFSIGGGFVVGGAAGASGSEAEERAEGESGDSAGGGGGGAVGTGGEGGGTDGDVGSEGDGATDGDGGGVGSEGDGATDGDGGGVGSEGDGGSADGVGGGGNADGVGGGGNADGVGGGTGGDVAARVGAIGFGSGAELLGRAAEAGSVSAVMMAFEVQRWRADEVRAREMQAREMQGGGRGDGEGAEIAEPERAVRERLLRIRAVMEECARSGMERDGVLPGGLNVPRRAKGWHERLAAEDPGRDPIFAEDWANLVAIAVNEENASGGRVVTAPTNGAAGIIPAVLAYALGYTDAGRRDRDDTTVRFLLTAAAIGSLFKERASISGAEVGCQGEVGSAASMAAGGLAEVLGGTPAQVENAAEIAMEHSLGLTCDPIGGLVQIPCIERNAISAGKAINAARMALRGDGSHQVSLDQVIETMRQTGRDMHSKYKETARGGLAVNVPVNVPDC